MLPTGAGRYKILAFDLAAIKAEITSGITW
jgi:hypothetical protein